eukprot:TRINITY_DN4019_c0_g1_i1.p1 TRINITY_DN4019_c0_g1~~TRINITY_DN4019_c0_g1_i1.p1  ORF type:complete len:149 (+),score=22.16 TRINITY_DN4019_c0_g1_i1:175-621(+)
MDAQKKVKNNWYFFRQRIKRQKGTIYLQQQIILDLFNRSNDYQHAFNSACHSLTSSLTQISALHTSLDKVQYKLNLALAQINIKSQICDVLKSQVHVLRIQKFHQILYHRNSQSSSLTNHPKKKKRKLETWEPISNSEANDYEDLDLF